MQRLSYMVLCPYVILLVPCNWQVLYACDSSEHMHNEPEFLCMRLSTVALWTP